MGCADLNQIAATMLRSLQGQMFVQTDFHDDSTDLFCSAGTRLTFFQCSTFRKCNVCADVGFDTDIHGL